MNDMVEDVTLEPFGVAYLHLRSQEHPPSQERPPVSGRVSDKCPFLSFSVLGVERSVNMVRDITFKSLGVSDLHLRSQEDCSMSRRVPDKCLDLFF